MDRTQVQFILSPSGDRLAVLPADDYEKLLAAFEDAADIANADRIMAQVQSGRKAVLPAAYAERLINGDTPVAVYRDWRGMTARALCEAVNISTAYLSQIEAGKRQGTVALMCRLARALDVSLDDLVMDETPESA